MGSCLEAPTINPPWSPSPSRATMSWDLVDERPCGQCPRQAVTIVHVTRARHQGKQVTAALRFAEEEGCVVEVRHSGQTWGHVVAQNGQRPWVWSTPKDADVAARMIRRSYLATGRGDMADFAFRIRLRDPL